MNPAVAEKNVPAAASDGLVEIVLTPTLQQYGEMGMDLEQARRALGLPKSAPKTEVIHEALRFAAASK